MRISILAIIFSAFTFISLSCKPDKTDNTEQATAQESQNADSKNHPARTMAEGMPIKVDAMGGPAKDQIKRQEIAYERSLKAEHLNTGGLEWTTFDRLAKNPPKDKKKYFVDVYTEWCGWCKVMDKKTFTDPEIQDYLKKNFHIVKFDAEQRENISFKGKEYQWINGGRKGINQLAIELLGNRMSYPTMVYLDENMNKITSSPGYKTPEQLIVELKAIKDIKS